MINIFIIILSFFVISCLPKEESVKIKLSKEQILQQEKKATAAVKARFNPGRISKYDKLIKKYARRCGFDWRLIAAQIFAESTFNPKAKSYCGAMGLMQIMPTTAKWLGSSPDLMYNPKHNIELGCKYNLYLYEYWKKKGVNKDRKKFVFASYNAGQGNVRKALKKANMEKSWDSIKKFVPKETHDYVPKIMKKFQHYKQTSLP